MNAEPAPTDLGTQRHLVAFRLDEQTYALPIEPVNRILEIVAITPIPQVRRPVAGVINVRGAAVPVVNMRQHFGLPEAPWQLDTHIILVQHNGRAVGLIVDEVLDVLHLPASQITAPTDILPEELGEAPLLQGLAHTSEGTVLVLNLMHLFRPSQTQALAQAVAALPRIVEEVPEEPPAEPKPQEQAASVTAPAKAATEKAPQEVSEVAPPQPTRTRRKRRSPRKAQEDAAAAEAAPQPARTQRKKRTSRKKAASTATTEETPPDQESVEDTA